jgi:hypothetical protein
MLGTVVYLAWGSRRLNTVEATRLARHATSAAAEDDWKMLEATEQRRVTKIYEQLRERLLDMSLRNPMLSYKHRSTSKRQLQIVDVYLGLMPARWDDRA